MEAGPQTAKNFGLISLPYSEADAAILPVPYEGSVTYGIGTRHGPDAIIKASHHAESYDFLKNRNYENIKIATLSPPELDGKTPEETMGIVQNRVSSILEDGKLPFLLGGEHSITGPAVRAVAAKHEIGVVQLDAHADLRHEYGGTIHSHACVMARVREAADAVQLGIRSCSIEEGELIRDENYTVLDPASALKNGRLENSLEKLPEKVYMTIDVDCMDPSIMPSTGTPEPGGFTWEQVNSIVQTVARRKTIVGADLVELAPIPALHAPDFLAARLVFNILAEIFLRR
ncbi:MAG: agmatinase [bacterium]|nr:MAG: agmatinase [bacterium]